MPIRPISIFARRISYQSTCVKVRTTTSSANYSSVKTRNCDYYSEEFSIERTKQSKTTKFCGVISSESFFPSVHLHRMPVVAAVVAHRRIYPAASSLASNASSVAVGVGSHRSKSNSSCASAVRLSGSHIAPTAIKKYARGSGSFSFAPPSGLGVTFEYGHGPGHGGRPAASRPLMELKQLGGAILKPKVQGGVIVETRRHYAKGRDKPKTKNTKIVVNEEEMGEVIDVIGYKAQLEKLIEQMKEDYTKQLNIRGAAGALESLEVEFDGEVYPLQELAQVGRKNPQLAVLNLASLPDAIKAVLKAIEDSGMNLNPQQEGTTIYVPLPKVTREHRETLAKNAKAMFVKYKTAIQGVQNKYVKQCRNQSDLSEDLLFSVQQQIMKFADNYIAEAEKLMQMKQKELLENK